MAQFRTLTTLRAGDSVEQHNCFSAADGEKNGMTTLEGNLQTILRADGLFLTVHQSAVLLPINTKNLTSYNIKVYVFITAVYL